MLGVLLMIASLTDWVPARWHSSDPASLDLLSGTPVNCLLQEQRYWSGAFSAAAAKRQIAVLGIVRPGPDATQSLRTAKEQGLNGVVLEGDFEKGAPDALHALAAKSGLA